MQKNIIPLVVFLLVAGGAIGATALITHEPVASDSAPAVMDGSDSVSGNTSTSSYDDDADDMDEDDVVTSGGASGGTGSATTGTTPVSTPAGYTLADVAKHNSSASCWTAVNGSVYDVTTWIKQHPGGQSAILSMCGKDGSSAFDGQHSGQRRPEQELAGFLIGKLI